MNILHLEASSGWGGQEMRILHEAEGMRLRGHQITFAIMKQGLLAQKAREAGFTVYEMNFHKSGWLITLFRLLRLIKIRSIDVVNTHSSLDSWIGGIAARISKRKLVRTRHLSGAIRSGWNSRILYGSLADFVVTTCEEIVSQICRQSGRSKDTCLSIPTGVEPERICCAPVERDQFREKLGLKPGQMLIGTACFMRSWKGIDDFLQAAHKLRNEPAIRWVIIGGGHFDTYKKKADQLHLDGLVHFTGHLDNPYPALAALDVFALLSTANEGVSQAILQAAYLEKPLLATPTGGLREVCIPGSTGIRVDCFSPDQVVSAALSLQRDPALRARMGQKAKRLVEERFVFKKTLDEMEKVYSALG
jgi:Glycosyltransferase